MNTRLWGLFLPVVFIFLHNVEEYRSFEGFKRFYFKMIDAKLRHRKVFLGALTVLTLFVIGICLLNYLHRSEVLRFAITMIAMLLLINGMQHIISSFVARKKLPGAISAIFLLVLSSIVYFVFLEKEIHFDFFDILKWVVIAIILMPLVIRISLYPRGFKNWFLATRKLAKFDDRKRPNIRNMGSFTIVEFRCFGAAKNPIFESSWVYGWDISFLNEISKE